MIGGVSAFLDVVSSMMMFGLLCSHEYSYEYMNTLVSALQVTYETMKAPTSIATPLATGQYRVSSGGQTPSTSRRMIRLIRVAALEFEPFIVNRTRDVLGLVLKSIIEF